MPLTTFTNFNKIQYFFYKTIGNLVQYFTHLEITGVALYGHARCKWFTGCYDAAVYLSVGDELLIKQLNIHFINYFHNIDVSLNK
jgi:hypothetical protein